MNRVYLINQLMVLVTCFYCFAVGYLAGKARERANQKKIIRWNHGKAPCFYYDGAGWCTLDQPDLCCPCSYYRANPPQIHITRWFSDNWDRFSGDIEYIEGAVRITLRGYLGELKKDEP